MWRRGFHDRQRPNATVRQEEVQARHGFDNETKIALAEENHWGDIRDVEL
jgi:hypothetical protein